MPLKNFDFPKVVLKQQFAEVPSGVGSTLGVACIGPMYHVYGGNRLAPLADYVGEETGKYYRFGTQFTGELPDSGVTGARYFARNPIVSYISFDADYSDSDEGSYTEYSDSYLASKGLGLIAASSAVPAGYVKLNLSFASAGEYPDPIIKAFKKHRPGENGGKIGFRGATGNIVWRDITGVGESGNGYYTIYFTVGGTEDIPATVSRYYLGYEYDGYLEVNAPSTTVPATTVLRPKYNGKVSQTDQVDFCPLFAAYRKAVQVDSFELMTFESLEDIETALGPVCADNPLALGCYCALMGGNGTVVYAVAVKDNSPLDYQNAIDFLDKYDGIYSIVPCVRSWSEESDSDVDSDGAIVHACVAACTASSADEENPLRRACWYGIDYKGANAGATIAGLVQQRQQRSNTERAVCVWSDDPILNGEHIANFAVAAAAAGMRAYEPAHRPLSNLGYSFLQLGEGMGLTRSQLKLIASNGIWVVANNNDGLPVNKRQLTTAVANNLNLDEESIIANTDNIAMTVHQVGKNWVGCSNISPAMLVLLRDSLQQILDYFQLNLTEDPMVGPPLLSAEIIKLYQDPVQKDRVYAVFNCEPPKPFNEFQMTMRVL